MLEVIVTYLILIALLLFPFWVLYRMVVSRETRSHLNALLLHDIIKGGLRTFGRLLTGTFRLVGWVAHFLVTEIRRLLRP